MYELSCVCLKLWNYFNRLDSMSHFKLFLVVLIILYNLPSKAQSQHLEPMFYAIVTTNIDVMSDWYTDVMGFDVVNQQRVPARGIRQYNMQLSNIRLELIQTPAVLEVDSLLNGTGKYKYLKGLFKIGFEVDNIDRFYRNFQEQGITISGELVTDPISKRKMFVVLDPDDNRIQFFESEN